MTTRHKLCKKWPVKHQYQQNVKDIMLMDKFLLGDTLGNTLLWPYPYLVALL